MNEDRDMVNINSEQNEDEEESNMALVVEDDEICQKFLTKMLNQMGIRCETAATVTEAVAVYDRLANQKISIDIAFLDIVLKDNSTGIEFLKIIREKKWMERTLIIVMSGIEDLEIVKECYNYNIQNFIRKPITKNSFLNETYKINKHLDSLKCPLAGYKIEKKLGAGASGTVHLIKHKKTKELYAMKTIQLNPEQKNRGEESEVKFYKNLKSPTILKLKEYKIEEHNLYIVLEYAEFGTLNEHIMKKRNENKVFDVDTILDWATELFFGLFTIHEKQLLHRDIKSENLFICENNILKIGDLGIARATETGHASTVCGTVLYMAPEVFNYQKYDAKVDIWAAGIVIYELIKLKRPFEGSNTDIIKAKIQNLEYEKVPDSLDERLKKIIKCTICSDPSVRSSALDILRLNFIAERVKKLFDTKLIDDEYLYYKVMNNNTSFSMTSIQENPFNESKSSLPLSEEDRKNLKEFSELFKIAIKIDFLALKSEYNAGYFSTKIPNVIKGTDMDLVITDSNISESEVESLLNNHIILNVSNPKSLDYDPTDNAYYQIKIFENILVHNSLIYSIDLSNRFPDPVKISLSCLLQADIIWNKFNNIEDNEQYDNNKMEIFSSIEYLEFLLEIKMLKDLNMLKYSKPQKLAIMLNIYQTMILHLNIKSMQTDENLLGGGLVESVKSLFKKTTSGSEIAYYICGEKLSIYEMKNIVMRRNRKPLDAYFRLANDSDNRLNFIDEAEDMLLKLHIICLDPQVYAEDYVNDYRIIEFNELNVYEKLNEYCRMFITDTVKKDDNQLNIPYFFKDYLSDFGKTDQDLIKAVLRLHNDSTLKPTLIIKQMNNKEININYY
jgi:serine/threonine protein kinase/ActR/RegA family two-component response regulator